MSTIAIDRTETETTAADLLNAAADLIEERGWCQFNHWGASGGFCAEGALIHVADRDWHPDAWSDAYLAVGDLIPRTQSLPSWNDKPGRTQAEVVGLLREAADHA